MGQDDPDRAKFKEADELLVQRLVNEQGVTEWQARGLVDLLGVDWSSLVREAQALRKLQ